MIWVWDEKSGQQDEVKILHEDPESISKGFLKGLDSVEIRSKQEVESGEQRVLTLRDR